ncbi:hypothetical protein ENBRE01_0112 [Enteropsectra breve]|nr:hypothetical protein ENBRE01_0112 [Enteropsectra breve]
MPQMTYVSPHTNTMIAELGTEYIKIGYTGDFHPIKSIKISGVSKNSTVCLESSLEAVLSVLAKERSLLKTDSLLLVQNANESSELSEAVARDVFKREIFSSFLVINSAVCEIFGSGKTSATVLSAGDESSYAAAVVKGVLEELHPSALSGNYIREKLYSEICGCLRHGNSNEEPLSLNMKNRIDELAEIIFGIDDVSQIQEFYSEIQNGVQSELQREVQREVQNEVQNEMQEIFALVTKIRSEALEQLYGMLDQIVEMRKTHNLRKVGTSGAIIFAGSLFKDKQLAVLLKEYLSSTHGAPLGEFVLYNESLDVAFFGASLFGMNDETKILFCTPGDYKRYGNKILQIKALK